MKIAPKTIQALQIELRKKFESRDERLEFLSQFIGTDLKTSKELTEWQARDVLAYLKDGKLPDNSSWASFDRNNEQHNKILSLCYELNWVTINPKTNKPIPDLNELGGWLKGSKCPINEPNKRLMQMEPKECTKVINALTSMLKKDYA